MLNDLVNRKIEDYFWTRKYVWTRRLGLSNGKGKSERNKDILVCTLVLCEYFSEEANYLVSTLSNE